MSRKTIIARMLAALTSAAMLFPSCSKEVSFEGAEDKGSEYQTFITATAEECAGTKASLEENDIEGYDVTWDEDDFLVAYLSSGSTLRRAIFELVDGAGTTFAKFGCKDNIDWSSYGIIDAYCDYNPDSDKWPSPQVFNPDGNMGISPMKASASINGKAPSLRFKNVGGAFRMTVTGCGQIANVTVEADELEPIALDCGADGAKVRMEGTNFWFSVPAGTYSGLKVTFADKDGGTIVKSLKKDLVIERSMVTTASLSGIPEMPLRLNVNASRMDASLLDWERRIVKEGHPYSVRNEFAKDESLSLCNPLAASSDDVVRFVTDGGAVAGSAMFYGMGAETQKEYAVIYPGGTGFSAANGDIDGLAVAPQQEIAVGMTKPSVQIWAGSAALSDEVASCTMTNMCAWVKIGLTELVGKVVMRSNDETAVLSASEAILRRSGSAWHLASRGGNAGSCYVSGVLKNSGYGDVWLSAMPCDMKNGFILEFYADAADETPLFIKRFDGRLNLTEGMILDCGKVYLDSESSLLARYNNPEDGYFFMAYGHRETLYEAPEIENLVKSEFEPMAIRSASPILGHPFDICFYASLEGAVNTLLVNGFEAEPTNREVEVEGIRFKEYVARGVLIPVQSPGKRVTLSVTNGGETVGIIPFPYLGLSGVKPEQFEPDSYYVLASSDLLSYVKASGNDYDYKFVASSSPSFFDDGVWSIEEAVNGRARLYFEQNGTRFYLQHQHYRPIVYLSKNTQGLDLWGEWTLSDGSIKHVTVSGNHADVYPAAGEDSILKASENGQNPHFSIYKIEVIR